MASRETVHEHFGRAAQFAQLLEMEIGTALLAIDALETQSFLSPNADAYRRLKEAIDRQTLGRSLNQIKSQLQLTDDIESQFVSALERRNTLTHRFYVSHGLKFLDEAGRDTMVLELQSISSELNRAWLSAQRISETLVRGVHMLSRLHNEQSKA
jgi:hypothetical protein